MYWNAFLIIGLILLIPTAYAAKVGAPWAPTRKRAIKATFDQLGIGAGDIVIDLGAGDGKVLHEAASRGAQAIGYELSPLMWPIAWLRNLKNRRVQVLLRNFYKQSLSADATVVFAFLLPANMPRLKEFLNQQNISNLKYVIAYAFPFKDLQPLQVIREKDCAPMYVYGARDLTISKATTAG